jgi:type IV pilus assembly protein PilY1
MRTNLFIRARAYVWAAAAAAGVLLTALAGAAHAATEIASVPLTQSSESDVRPNLMLILDDSGSMARTYMPDAARTGTLCEGYHGVNKIFFNPGLPGLDYDYPPPIKADGTSYPNAVFAAAYSNGYEQSGSVDLRNVANLSTPVTQVGPTSSKFYYATYKGSASPATPVCSGRGYDLSKWDIVTNASAWTDAQRTNYANWYSYYRTRLMTVRAGTGRAFAGLNPAKARVGFTTISDNTLTESNKFLHVRDFDSGTQKADFFSRLYGVGASGSTPLRPPLEKTGKYFANKVPGQTYDPMQYSCQRNHAILATDGHWNTANEPSGYVPKRLDGVTNIGNQDSGQSVLRPKRDECDPTTATNDPDGCKPALGSGVSNSLADIAAYFYNTDLRSEALGNCTGSLTGQNVCTNKPADDSGSIKHQNMSTYTIGLGVNGLLSYRSDYKAAGSGDYWDITQGNKVWPNPFSNSSDPRYSYSEVDARIDDLWHAAVNGGGIYFSAANALELSNSLLRAFADVDSKPGSGAAAATSSLRPTAGDDWLFFSLYTSVKWTGDVRAHKIDPATGAVLNPDSPIWEASAKITSQASRTIYFHSPGQTNKIASFTYANLSTAQKAYFDNLCQTGSEKLSQCVSLPAADRANATGANLVNYLRGTRTHEMSSTTDGNRVFRTRESLLGDVVNASPVYVKQSPLKYVDAGHNTFAAGTKTRMAVVYVAANDGMLHAIKVGTGAGDTTGGTELWAYVPSMVMPNMHLLADANYASKHQYFVDGTPVVGDVYDSATSSWKTILVGGLGGGGRGYYALDITDPASPKVLWEISSAIDADIGLTYGNPVIAKNKANKWVVAFSSGYNNVSPGGGNGHLFVVDAITGSLNAAGAAFDISHENFRKIKTTIKNGDAGSQSTPNNLGKINAWVEDDTNNIAERFYAGDMLGNVWRFDFDDKIAPSGNEAERLGFADSNQPITTKPQLSVVKVGATRVPIVSVATGRLLGLSDLTDTSTQSVYTFKDILTAAPIGDLRSGGSKLVEQTLGADRKIASLREVDWTQKNGWYVDLKVTPGERVNVDPLSPSGQLAVLGNIPSPTPCASSGSSWLYFFDLATGEVLKNQNFSWLSVGMSMAKLTNGKLATFVQGTSPTVPKVVENPLTAGSAAASTVRRISWREIIN